jgi:hypothetical protein
MPLVLIMRTSLAATMCAIGRKIFHRQLGENFTRDQHGNKDKRDICRRDRQFEVETIPIDGSRKTNVIANAFMERSVAATDR